MLETTGANNQNKTDTQNEIHNEKKQKKNDSVKEVNGGKEKRSTDN